MKNVGGEEISELYNLLWKIKVVPFALFLV